MWFINLKYKIQAWFAVATNTDDLEHLPDYTGPQFPAAPDKPINEILEEIDQLCIESDELSIETERKLKAEGRWDKPI